MAVIMIIWTNSKTRKHVFFEPLFHLKKFMFLIIFTTKIQDQSLFYPGRITQKNRKIDQMLVFLIERSVTLPLRPRARTGRFSRAWSL